MVELRTYGSPSEAYISKGLLDSYGIKSAVKSNATSNIFPAPDAGIGVTSLYVDEKDESRAREILKMHGD